MLASKIALRYLFSKKSHSVVNIISYVSIAGVALAAAAMVIVLSVFNGFSDLVERKISSVEPDFTVEAAKGKVIADADSIATVLESIPGVIHASGIITEKAFAIAGERQMPVTIRGIDPQSPSVTALGPMIIDGSLFVDSAGTFVTALASVGAANTLLTAPSAESLVRIYEPRRRGRINPAAPMNAFRADSVAIAGVYCIDQPDYDRDIIIIPLATARRLLDYTNEATMIEIHLDNRTDARVIGQKLSGILGDGFIVKDKIRQQEQSFRMIKIEKWVTLLMLTFILLIASFNILSTMSMLIVEKRANMSILKALGASAGMVRNIFSSLTFLIAAIGGAAGILIGLVLALLQQWGGFIKLNTSDPSALSVTSYPVRVNPADTIIVILIVAIIGLLTAAVIRLTLRRIKE